MTVRISNLETNRPSSDFVLSEVTNSTFDSTALDSLIPFLAREFNLNNFIYDNFDISNSGSGVESWINNEITTGMMHPTRYGIGYFYFLRIGNEDVAEPLPTSVYTEEPTSEVVYWDFLTTFFDYLK